jgi:hypothetical protein
MLYCACFSLREAICLVISHCFFASSFANWFRVRSRLNSIKLEIKTGMLYNNPGDVMKKREAQKMKKSVIIITAFISTILGLFGCGSGSDQYEAADTYKGFRNLVFSSAPGKMGLEPSKNSNPVWGILCDIGNPEGVLTILALGDGTVSVYYSNGGAVIGLGAHEGPRKAARELLKIAPQFLKECKPTNDYPLPRKGYTRFYIFTFEAILTVEVKLTKLISDRHPHKLLPLYVKTDELFSAILIYLDEQKKDSPDRQ